MTTWYLIEVAEHEPVSGIEDRARIIALRETIGIARSNSTEAAIAQVSSADTAKRAVFKT